MSWNTPKYDFVATDGYTYTHANNVGENQYILHQGNSGVTTVTFAGDLGINMQHHCFYVSGAGTINRIRYTDGTDTRLPGNVIFLICNSIVTLQTGSGTSGQYYGLLGQTTTCVADEAYCLILYGTKWHILKNNI